MNYIQDLVDLICGRTGETPEDGQVDIFIKKTMRNEYSVKNGNPPSGRESGTERFGKLQNFGPREASRVSEGLEGVNDPLYPSNMIDRMNTPFDHVERILLQDFSETMKISGENYFRNLFKMTPKSESKGYGIVKIEMEDVTDNSSSYPLESRPDYGLVNEMFKDGEFFVDSFTYTPFIDYSQTQYPENAGDESPDVRKTGIYSDQFLNDYNCGRYESDYSGGEGKKKDQVDIYRGVLTSNMFSLRNLEKDIYDAKFAFRDAIDRDNPSAQTDAKAYIYTFCEHLASLFAKLSNIRMSHEIYGFKHPHTEWEGILALDIWYQMLYREIDAKYSFDDRYMNMNPMARRRIVNGTVEWNGSVLGKSEIEELGLSWIEDDSAPGYAYIWNQDMFETFDRNANDISDRRHECVTPRGVLKKIFHIVYDSTETIPHEIHTPTGGWSDDNIVPMEDRDFDWFHQIGKVYSDKGKSPFTKYVNLHLGRAYDVMSAREWHYMIEHVGETDVDVPESYGKNLLRKSVQKQLEMKSRMIVAGYKALYDAFCVMKNEHVFNIFNSTANEVEEFNPEHAGSYSQGQCAIVIERVFSRLYRYLHFKSTTSEKLQTHINIDSGYKYLTTDSLLANDNKNAGTYYDDGDDVSYLRYLEKISQYKNSSLLTDEEKTVLSQFIKVLSRKPAQWLNENWNLCPLCKSISESFSSLMELSPQERDTKFSLVSREKEKEDEEEGEEPIVRRKVVVNLSLPYCTWEGNSIAFTPGTSVVFSYKGNPQSIQFETQIEDSRYAFNTSRIMEAIQKNPHYDFQGTSTEYWISGFSLNDGGEQNFGISSDITVSDFGESSVLNLYAIWNHGYIVQFNPGDIQDVCGSMSDFVTYSDSVVLAPCGYYPDPEKHSIPRVRYFTSDAWEQPSISQTGDSVTVYQFDGWTASLGQRKWKVGDASRMNLHKISTDVPPVVILTANWKVMYSSVPFKVGGETFCEVLVSTESQTLDILPESPVMVSGKFLWWDTAIGSYIGFDNRNRTSIVCGECTCENPSQSQGQVVAEMPDGEPDGPIVCAGNDYAINETSVNAVLSDQDVPESQILNLTFMYMRKNTETGEIEKCNVIEKVMYNGHVPSFHIHQEIPFTEHGEQYKYVFRYWTLESGTITSSMTVLSDSVLSAVYDMIKIPVSVEEPVETEESNLGDEFIQNQPPSLDSCDKYLSTSVNRDGCKYCKYGWVDPKIGKNDLGRNEVECPYVRLLLDGEITSEGDTFAPMTLMEIDDISNLLKALFKINIDISHREYFLKVDIPDVSDRWYGEKVGHESDEDNIVCLDINNIVCLDTTTGNNADDIICTPDGNSDSNLIICRFQGDEIICSYNGNTQIVCVDDNLKWISFEPVVEFKFSNFHAANQVVDNNLVCTVDDIHAPRRGIVPVNRELASDENGLHYNDFFYFYDYRKTLVENFVKKCAATIMEGGDLDDITPVLTDRQRYYSINPISVYQNSSIQSPVDVNDFIRNRVGTIVRGKNQLRTYTSVVKKYRPIIMPGVRDIFDDCQGAETKYEADVNNDYGVFGWCTIPSKTMVNMEYNEQTIIVPSSYDHHNRIGGSNFLQMDKDMKFIYTRWNRIHPEDESDKTGNLEWNARNTWYYLYNTRDWTYFLLPFFNIKQNSELYSYMLDTYWKDTSGHDWRPNSSDHINGVIFEHSNEGRQVDQEFGDVASSCEFLAKYHHNENNLRILSERYTNLISYATLKEMTQDSESGQFNSMYGSRYQDLPENFRFPFNDWIDDYDKTGSYVDLKVGDYNPDSDSEELKYEYNLGQSHAIDDFDEDSVWFYITMVEPIEELNQVIELEDIMPFVFWWENRGEQNNGPAAIAYGRASSARLNYEVGGWCYSNPVSRDRTIVDTDLEVKSNGDLENEHLWHAVQHTIGTDFSRKENGGTVLTSDNSGNVYKGAFDPNCSGTDEKWKIHHPSNAFGANQNEDPTADKYYFGENAHGDGEFDGKVVPDEMNETILDSIQDRPMTWNLWNVVRHYAYLKYFKNLHRALGSEHAAWQELENYTKKIVKGIYRTFKQKQRNSGQARATFGEIDGSSTNYGGICTVDWTNSFVEINTVLERNAREHNASFVLFTGDERKLDEDAAHDIYGAKLKFTPGISQQDKNRVCVERAFYDAIRGSKYNFRVLTLEGVDGDDSEDGMRPRKFDEESGKYVWDKPEELMSEPDPNPCNVYQGMKYSDLPTTYILGDSTVYNQQIPDVDIQFLKTLDLDIEFPESEYYRNSTTQKWVRRIRQTVMNRQLFPVYTSMEGMTKSHHDLTVSDMKGITFQIVPQFYWKYEGSFNEFMIHRVGKLNSPSHDIVMYDMLGNVWEWVRDDWMDGVSGLNGKSNPIVGTSSESPHTKVIKGGAFDQFVRKVISPAREELSWDSFKSKFATQANVGFRPSMVYSSVGEGGFTPGQDPVDIFFLFDASASQDSEITKMLDSAKDIVKMFSGDENGRDICHVGSGLFLGPTIRLMCCKQITLLAQKGWHLFSNTAITGTSTRPTTKPTHNYSIDMRSIQEHYPWDGSGLVAEYFGTSDKEVRKTTQPLPGREDWMEIKLGDLSQLWSGTGVDGKPAGLWNKFKNFRDNVWMAGESQTSRGQVIETPDPDPEDYMDDFISYKDIQNLESPDDEIEINDNIPTASLLSARDGGGSGGTGDLPGGDSSGVVSGPTSYVTSLLTESWAEGITKYMNLFCGVPVWKDDNRELHFGQIPEDDQSDWSRYGYKVGNTQVEGKDMFKSKFNFFTYDPTESGIASFEWPFCMSTDPEQYKNYKGVLSNWWAGCEPSCDMLSKLLRYQCFYGYPWHIGIGYLFRKNTPRLVFVFTNEYDNSMSRTYNKIDGSWEYETVVAPSFDGSTVTFKEITSRDQNAPDPYCLQLLQNYQPGTMDSFKNYMDSLNLDWKVGKNSEAISAIQWLGRNSGISTMDELMYRWTVQVDTKKNWEFGSSQKIAYGFSKFHDLNQNPYPLEKSGKPLTDYQMKYVENNQGRFPWTYYGEPNQNGIVNSTLINYQALKTMGFYQLNVALRDHVNYPLNTYFMVQDANAPRTLYSVPEPDWENITDEEKAKIAFSLLPEKDTRLFKDIGNCILPDDIQTILGESGIGKNTGIVKGGKYTWNAIRGLSAMWHYKVVGGSNVNSDDAQALDVILGLENPYEKTTLVFCRRDNLSRLQQQNGWRGSGDKDYFESRSGVVTIRNYTYFLGIPTESEIRSAISDEKWKDGFEDAKEGSTEKTTVVQPGTEFIPGFSQWLQWNIWGKWNASIPTGYIEDEKWISLVHSWARNFKFDEGVDGNAIPPKGKAWIEKHLCPWSQFGKSSRKKIRRMGKYTLTQENMELVGFTFQMIPLEEEVDENKKYRYALGSKTYPCYISKLFSSESFCVGYGDRKDDNYVWTSPPDDFITLTYTKDDGVTKTGTLKIVTMPDILVDTSVSEATGKRIVLLENKMITVGSGFGRNVLLALAKTTWSEYPDIWKKAVKAFSQTYSSTVSGDGSPFLNTTVLKFVYDFYRNLKLAMPSLLGYRYQNQIMSQFTNMNGKNVTDYEDDENFVVMKTLPIMDVGQMKDTFASSFGVGGQLNSTKNFSYTHCVVDLDPYMQEYDDSDFPLQNGKFPMSFSVLTDVNMDEYKTNKIVLSRIDQISGDKTDTYIMGSRTTDYDKVTDVFRLKYRDEDAIVSESPDDNASVTLGNAGSYQKRRADLNLNEIKDDRHPEREYDHPSPDQDLFWIDIPERDKQGLPIDINGNREGEPGFDGTKLKMMKKYFKNRHFFIDPFELTIAQWCYVKLNSQKSGSANRETARNLLQTEGHLGEMQKSYWKYLRVWENEDWIKEKAKWVEANAETNDIVIQFMDDWKSSNPDFVEEWKQQNPQNTGETTEEYESRAQTEFDNAALEAARNEAMNSGFGKSDDGWMQMFIDDNWYNPLEDTRPYYYASYQNVRGTSQIYRTPVPGSRGNDFVIDPEKGDEFQMNTRTGGTSFMDILNNNVVRQAQERIYGNGQVKSVTEYESSFGDSPTREQIEQIVNSLKGEEYDEYGESPLMPYLMDARDNKLGLSRKDRKKTWCWGKLGGMNFDLPTEAQWEYCCRAGSDSAFPRENNLGQNFEERNESLDLIAWYKYKVIGALPEPERFCAWRISRMLFGISRDSEQINNVYEPLPE